MNNLMYEITVANIRIAELKIKRIELNKQRLYETKPIRLKVKKTKLWQAKLEKLEKDEKSAIKELQNNYDDLEKMLK